MKKIISLIGSYWKKSSDCEAVLKDYKDCKDLEGSLQSTTNHLNHTYDNSSFPYKSNTYLSHNAIKACLEDLSRLISSQKEFSEDYWQIITKERLTEKLKTCSQLEQNVWFLWAAFSKREDFFQLFLEAGADLSFHEHTFGLSPLHLAAFSGSKNGLNHLVSTQSHLVNQIYKNYSPLHCAVFGNSPEVVTLLLDRGADVKTFTKDGLYSLDNVLHCAVRANAVECLEILCRHGAELNQLNNAGLSPIHLAVDLGRADCLRILISQPSATVNLPTLATKQTALHLAATQSKPECVEILLEFGALVGMLDYRYRTPLHLAAKAHCLASLKLLLQTSGINVNSQDFESRTPLHLALSKISQKKCSQIVEILIRHGADVNSKDRHNYTPLHLAAQNQLPECVDLLILNEADVTAKCKEGKTALKFITQKTPLSIDTIRKKLDACIQLSSHSRAPSSSGKEFEFQIDFSSIIRHSHPREALFLATLIEEGHKSLLLHPVCRAFCHLKWGKVKKYFIFKTLWCFLLVTVMSSYILMGLARHCYNFSKNATVSSYAEDKELCLNHSVSAHFILKHPEVIEFEWYLMVLLALGTGFRKICGFHGYSSVLSYFTYVENFLDWGCIATVFLISFIYTGRTYVWQNHLSAFAVLLSWVDFMLMLGQFPFFGTYVAMYIAVQREFAKIILVFLSLLVGFTVSFCVLFPESQVFSNIYIGLLTVSVMAVGEMNLDLVTDPSKEESVYMLQGSSEVIYAAFVTCVSIIMLNLLVGIAVHDIKALKSSAKLTKLTKAIQLVNLIEKSLLADRYPQKLLLKCFKWDLLISSDKECTFKVYSPGKVLLSQNLLQEAYGILRKRTKRRTRCAKLCSKETFSGVFNGVRRSEVQVEMSELKVQMEELGVQMLNLQNLLESNQRVMEQILKMRVANEIG